MSATNPEFLHTCPLCLGRVESFRGPNDHTMGTCTDCGVSFVIPATAWEVARSKPRERKSQRHPG